MQLNFQSQPSTEQIYLEIYAFLYEAIHRAMDS